ncbi:NUDIX hydrolase [Faecalimonas sp.]
MMEELKRINRTLKYEGSILKVYTDEIQLPNSNIAHWDYIHHNGATAIVPIRKDGKILLVRQYRNALDRETLEIPAGKLDDKNEKPILCALRELEEETGYVAGKITHLITLCTWVAFTNEKIEVYVAEELKSTMQHLDEDEFIDVEAYTIEEIKEKIFSGEIQDAKTISSLLAYENWKKKE